MSFAGDLRKFRKRAGINAADLKRAVGIKLFSAIVQDTPVGTSDPSRQYVGGRLRANWQAVNGGTTLDTVPTPDPTGARTLSLAVGVIVENDLKEDLVIVNNLPYGPRIEFDGWSHTKAPQGMVRKNVVRFQRLVTKEARRIRNGGN